MSLAICSMPATETCRQYREGFERTKFAAIQQGWGPLQIVCSIFFGRERSPVVSFSEKHPGTPGNKSIENFIPDFTSRRTKRRPSPAQKPSEVYAAVWHQHSRKPNIALPKNLFVKEGIASTVLAWLENSSLPSQHDKVQIRKNPTKDCNLLEGRGQCRVLNAGNAGASATLQHILPQRL